MQYSTLRRFYGILLATMVVIFLVGCGQEGFYSGGVLFTDLGEEPPLCNINDGDDCDDGDGDGDDGDDGDGDDGDGDDSDQNKGICHVPPGNPENAHFIPAAEPSWEAHLSHHDDYLGPCNKQ